MAAVPEPDGQPGSPVSRWRPRSAAWLPGVAHVIPSLWLFAGPLFEGRVLFFRDLSFYYHPNDVFVARALAQGVWPLWNPTSDAGAPFLLAYPVELLLVGLLGARVALALGAALHVWLAMSGATLLARRLGAGPWGSWAAGLSYGASGFVLSCVSLRELFHGAAWAPWVLAAFLALIRAPTRQRALALGLLTALQLSTLSGEMALQTALVGLVLLPALPRARATAALAVAALLALLAALPALLGVWMLVEGTPRAQGLPAASTFAWSASGTVLVEAVLPQFFGNVHSFSDQGYWGQPFFPSGQPYLLSLYLGVPVLLLSAAAGLRHWRLWILVVLGVLLALGSHGPVAWALAPLMRSFRSPVKFIFLAELALCLLAGLGLDALRVRRSRPAVWALLPGAILLAAGLSLLRWPGLPARLLGGLLPALAGEQARTVAAHAWPPAFLVSGALAGAAGLVIAWMPRWAPLAAVLAGLDVLIVNGGLNPAAEAGFYELRPEVRALVERAAAEGPYRWFSYGVANSPPLHWRPVVARQDSDVWLFYMDRQSLLPRTHVLDGLEGAFDEDRVGWAPPGSTLGIDERTPLLFAQHYARLRQSNVRWVVAFHQLPGALVSLFGQATLPAVAEPVRIYELRDPLPRAFWVPQAEIVSEAGQLARRVLEGDYDPRRTVLLDGVPAGLSVDAPSAGEPAPARVSFERLSPEAVRVQSSSPPGFVVVLEGYHPYWKASDPEKPVPLLRANGRYWALPTPGGDRTITVQYEPPWRGPALLVSLAAALTGLAGMLAPAGMFQRGRRGVRQFA